MFRELRDADWLTVSNEGDGAEPPVPGEVRAAAKAVANAPSPPAADTVGGGIAGAGTLAVGSSVDVVIETQFDHDWYAVTLTEGTAYTIHTTFDATSTDAFLIVRNSAGVELVSDDDSGERNNSLIGFTPTVSGTYYIDAGTFQDDTTGSFHLSLAAVVPPGDSVFGTIATTATLAVTGSIDGNIDSSGDHDFYRITLTAGQTYQFRTGGTTATDVTNTRLTLRDANGAQLATNDDVGEGAFSGVRYTATTTGDYYLDVSGLGSATGAFNLTAFTSPTPVLFTYDQIASQLTDGYWGGNSHRFAVTAGGSLTFSVLGLTAAGQTLAREALAIWSDVTGIAFNEVGTGGMIVYDDEGSGASASASYSNGITTSAQINVSKQWLSLYGSGLNSYTFQAYLHETGHALGLGHAGNYNTTADYGFDSLYLNDSWATTVMSYFDQTENAYFAGLGFTRQFLGTPMIADGIAAASLYGAATTTRTGNTTYGFNNSSGRTIYDAATFPGVGYTIYDNGGVDTLDYSGFSANQVINLNAETFSNVGNRIGNVSIARGTVIENAIGGSGNDTITGNAAANLFRLDFGGNDTVSGGGGDDGFYFGAGLTAGDSADGGPGTNDQLGLQGNYAGFTLAATHLVNIVSLLFLPGNDTRFGDVAGNFYSYNVATLDANVAAGQLLTVNFNTLRVGENVTFNGSAESNGSFLTFGGLGNDNLAGGQQTDGFYFGIGRWGASDTADGQGGSDDQLGLQGLYAGATAVVFGASQLVGIETLVLLSGGDARFGSGGLPYSYHITMHDNNVGAGQTMTINANTLRSDETLTFNGSAETDGRFTIFSGAGNDVIVGSSGADTIYGGAGADTMTGGAGADLFAWLNVAHSTVAAPDLILDFASGDRLGLSAIDADTATPGDQAFHLGATAGHAGDIVLAFDAGNNRTSVSLFVDGDAIADGVIWLTGDRTSLTGADFVL